MSSSASSSSSVPLAAAETREVFWGLGTAAEVLWYALATASVVVFAYGVARLVAKYRIGRPGAGPPRSEIPRRLLEGARLTASHISIAYRDSYAGWAHRAIFYGFLVLFIGTVILAVNTDFTEPVLGWRFFDGPFYLGYSLVLDALGLALLFGLLAMMIRRSLIRPRKLDYARPDRAPDDPDQLHRSRYRVGDWVFVVLLLVIVLSGYVLEAARIAMDHPGNDAYSPVGWLVAQGLGGVGRGTLDATRQVLWWSHGLLAIAFVASIPYTKAMHMLVSFTSLAMRDTQAGKRLQPVPDEGPVGYGALADLSRIHLLDLDACTRCGKCHEACPADATGLPLSPRDVVLELREQANDAFSELAIGGVLGSLIAGRPPHGDGAFARSIFGERRVRTETVWSCMQCNACVEACPVGIEQAPIINQMRRRLLEDGRVEPGIQSMLKVIRKSGNSFGERARKRGRWTEELEFEVPDARTERVDVLWFVGDYASFDPRSQEISRTLARLLHAAGVSFGIMFDGERNAGNDVRRIGEEGLYLSLAEQNIAALAECEFQRIITTDPHSLNTIRNEYPPLGGSWQVSHHTTLLLELLDELRLGPLSELGYRVTYHDPCHLGRFNGEFDAPRELLERTGCVLVEMPRNRESSFCCGAGGGRIWMTEPVGDERPSENRIHEAMALDGVDLFVVSCPKDVTMYEDAIKTTGNDTRLALREITELVAQSVGLSSPGKPDASAETGSS
jgi:Fe-S oxidoreductase/nitrate reductase gamma subunit